MSENCHQTEAVGHKRPTERGSNAVGTGQATGGVVTAGEDVGAAAGVAVSAAAAVLGAITVVLGRWVGHGWGGDGKDGEGRDEGVLDERHL